MRILIADDSTAAAKALRAAFPRNRAKGRAAKTAGKSALPAEALVVSCAAAKTRSRGTKDEDCSCHGLDLCDQPEQGATILDALGVALLNRGCLDEGAQLIELALTIRRKFFGDEHPATAASLNSRARVRRERGDYDDAESDVQEALRINRKTYGDSGLPVAVSLNELGTVQLQQGRLAAAEQSAIEGLDILEDLGLTATDPNTTRLMDIRGRAEAGRNKLPQAAATFDTLLKLDRKQLGTTDHPKYATHFHNSGLVKEAQGKFSQAEQAYSAPIDVYLGRLGIPCHPNLIDAYANLGSLLRARAQSRRDLEKARDYLEKALRLNERVRGPMHVLVGNDHANLGRVLYDLGEPRTAAGEFKTALGIYEKNVKRSRLPADHYFVAETLTWQGRIQVESNKPVAAASAEPTLERAISIWPVHVGTGSVGEAIAKGCLGRSLYLQGKDPVRARKLLEEAYPIVLKECGKDHPLTQRIAEWLRDLDRGSMPAAA